MRNFILVISVTLITTNAYAWGTSQAAVPPEHEIKKVEEFKGVPEAERVGKPAQPAPVIKENTGPVDMSWKSRNNVLMKRIGDVNNDNLIVVYGQGKISVGFVRIFTGPAAGYTMKVKLGAERNGEIVINGQRLISHTTLEELNPCKTYNECEYRRKNNPNIELGFYTSIKSDEGNEWAYNVLKNSKSITVKLSNGSYTVDLSGFNAADSRHSVAF